MLESNVEAVWTSIWSKSPDFAPINSEHDTISILTRNIVRKIGHINEITFLDIGSGPGSRTIPIVGTEQNIKLILLDQSIEALALAQKYSDVNNVKTNYVQADGFQLPFPDNSVECVFANGVNEHFLDPNRQILFEEMKRVAKPDGLIAVIAPNKFNFFHTANKVIAERKGTWQFGPQYDFTPFELKDRAKKTGLKDVEMYGVGAYTSFIRMFPRDTQRSLHKSPTPFSWLNNILWKLDENDTSVLNRIFGREIMVLGKK